MEPEVDVAAERRAKYGEQDEWGNQVGSLRLNLKRTAAQRLQMLQAMVDFAHRYQGAIWRSSKSDNS
ncbi:MAG: hypothetical protein K1X67_01970 [Fimbriimonadaceae bacterium]|nr:hypothetical protein [Fimbriimonadaceae bacterium]